MIKIDIFWAIAIFLSVSLGIVFVLWIFYNFRRGSTANQGEIQQCPYCTHVFLSHDQGDIQACPRCQSYIGEVPRSE